MFPLIFFSILLALNACTSKNFSKYTCLDCHQKETFSHAKISCTVCHGGKEGTLNKKEVHKGLNTFTTYEEVEKTCASCHPEEVKNFKNSLHFTYERELKSIFKGFGISLKVRNFYEFSKLEGNFSTKAGLLIDFLKRRCLTCHIFSQGENYPKTSRKRGCLSCHKIHEGLKPKDETCLSCHYSIRVGWDYYGYSPHPWFIDYRSPFIEGKVPERPYGIEAYNLKRDIHKEKNFSCIDCHRKNEIMKGQKEVSCLSCHKILSNNIFHKNKVLSKVRCEVCHANFINQDGLKICYLEMDPNLEDWYDLSVQESYEIEKLVEAHAKGKKVKKVMTDKFTDKEKEGLWLCTLDNRTYLDLNIGKDEEGKLCIKRKESLYLVHQNISLYGNFNVCTVPHTIGKADLNRSLYILNKLR
ncbi:MAG: hypothetical protein ACP5QC_07975 [Caldimicrobium sp.]